LSPSLLCIAKVFWRNLGWVNAVERIRQNRVRRMVSNNRCASKYGIGSRRICGDAQSPAWVHLVRGCECRCDRRRGDRSGIPYIPLRKPDADSIGATIRQFKSVTAKRINARREIPTRLSDKTIITNTSSAIKTRCNTSGISSRRIPNADGESRKSHLPAMDDVNP